jgi:hypothetical protein
MALPGSLWRDREATLAGVAYGVAAFLTGFLASLALVFDDVDQSDELLDEIATRLGPTLGDVFRDVASWLEPGSLQAVGWFFYNSHYVPLEVRASALGQRLSASVSLQQTPMWNSALVLVPPVVLLGAGYLFARRQSDDGAPSALACGVRIALGYSATAAGGVYLVGYSRSAAIAAITLQPAVGTAALYCGGYALAFGTGGALLYSTYGHSGPAPSEPKSRR